MHNEYIHLSVTGRISDGKSLIVQHQRIYRSNRYLHYTAMNYSLYVLKMFDSTAFDRIIRLVTRYRKHHTEFYIHLQIGTPETLLFQARS